MKNNFKKQVLYIGLVMITTTSLIAQKTDSQDITSIIMEDSQQGSGTSEDPYLVPETESEIKLDGIPNENVWHDALMLELLYEVRPGENIAPPVQTQVLLISDSKNLYAAFRCYDPDPSAIRAYLRSRDSYEGDDMVSLILDTFNDQRRSFVFRVTAQGVQMDLIETQNGEDDSWDGIWDCTSAITDWGYSVEIVVPFSTISFQRGGESQTWGFDAVRSYPRDHNYQLGLFPRDRSNNCYLCQAVKIKGFEGVTPGRNIEVNPTLTAIRTDIRDNFPEGDIEKENLKADLGATVRWGITPNLTLNLTGNPDFSQVEADARQLDINRPFALFYREKRPFFTEGPDYFSALEQIIYTRTIRDPSWGVKLTGKEGPNSIGAFLMRDEVTNIIFPGNQESSSTSLNTNNLSSVLRYRRDFGSRYSAGLILTDREGDDYFNRVYGADLNFRFTPTDQIQLLVLGSNTKYQYEVAQENNQSTDILNDGLVSFEYDHTSRTWGWWADYEEAGSNFRADLGYFPMVGYRNVEGGINYTWNAPEDSWWSLFRVSSEANYYDDRRGNLIYKQASIGLSYAGSLQSHFNFEAGRAVQTYKLHSFKLTSFSAGGNFRPTSSIRYSGSLFAGNEIDYANIRLGDVLRFRSELLLNSGKRLQLVFYHTYERMRAMHAPLYTANISQLNASYHFTVHISFKSIIQYVNYDYNPVNYTFEINDESKDFFTQFLFSYQFNPRTVLFLGYTDNYFGDQNIQLMQKSRTFFMKLGYAWLL